MTRSYLGSSLASWLRLAPAAETQGNAPAAAAAAGEGRGAKVEGQAKPDGKVITQPIGLSAVDLMSQLEADPNAYDTTGADDDDGDAKGGDDKSAAKGETAEAKAAREKQQAEAKAAAEAKAKAEGGKTPELNADQKAWLELRAAAKTPEEAAELDKQAPAFTDEEWALVEAETAAREAAKEAKPDELQTQLTAAQEEATRFKTEAEAKSKRLQEVEAELAQAKTQPIAVANLHPLFTADAAGLDRAEQEALAVKEWAARHWDGAEAQGDQPAYSAQQVRTANVTAEKLLSHVIPQARQALANHIAENTETRRIYPELFNPQSEPLAAGLLPPYQSAQAVLKRAPGLRAVFPNINALLGDMIVGEQLRTVLLAEKPTAEALAARTALLAAIPALGKFVPALQAKPAGKPGGKLPAKPIVPLARPGSAAAAPGRKGSAAPGKPTGAPNVNKFVTQRTENGGDELAALTATLAGVNVG